MSSPYTGLHPNRFWRTGVSEAHPLTVSDLYRKKFSISALDKIATAGSCFAQHVANYLRTNGFLVMDAEPPPPLLPEDLTQDYGYGIYSARYGNIYTVRQLLQLARDADSASVDAEDVWTKNGRYYDALRPNVEPKGLDSVEETLALRRHHLAKVKQLFSTMDVFIFTLGLTEAWVDRRSGRVFPTAPGTIAGEYDPDIHVFRNFEFGEIRADFVKFIDLVSGWNPGLRIILTVSPVPLTATATANHVLVATTYSKSVLRAVAGSLADAYPNIDYFPSYEMIASPWSKGFFYEANMRAVNSGGVAAVMRVFFDQHRRGEQRAEMDPKEAADREEMREARRARRAARPPGQRRRGAKNGESAVPSEGAAAAHGEAAAPRDAAKADDVVCEEILLEAFAP